MRESDYISIGGEDASFSPAPLIFCREVALSRPGQRLAMYSACLDIVSHSDEEPPAGVVNHAVGTAHDGAAPPYALRRGGGVDDREKKSRTNRVLCLDVCPQSMQGVLPSISHPTALGMSPGRTHSELLRPQISWPGGY